MEKYFPYDWNGRKNSNNLKSKNKIEIAVICLIWEDGPLLISQYIDVIIGKEYAPISISNKKILIFFKIKCNHNII